MKTYAILLRGVTPTGRNRVPMAQLRTALVNAGLLDVQTYIQSGNVVAKSRMNGTSVQTLVHDVIASEIGADLSIIARTHAQLKKIMANNPFPLSAASRTYFSLLLAPPEKQLMNELIGMEFSPDRVENVDDTLYTLYATKYSDSKYNNNYFERKLKMPATTRNFNTLSRLLDMTA